MRFRFTLAAFAALASAPLGAAFAGEVACPTLSTAVQVEPCPSEEELRYTFNGFCGDNARLYAKDMDTCVSYENYREVKNIALWEAGGGEFQSYVSCGLDPVAVKAAKARRIVVGKAGKLTRVACEYAQGIVFAHRTRSACKVVGDDICPDGNCRASCD